jgi:hypothetical protein
MSAPPDRLQQGDDGDFVLLTSLEAAYLGQRKKKISPVAAGCTSASTAHVSLSGLHLHFFALLIPLPHLYFALPTWA